MKGCLEKRNQSKERIKRQALNDNTLPIQKKSKKSSVLENSLEIMYGETSEAKNDAEKKSRIAKSLKKSLISQRELLNHAYTKLQDTIKNLEMIKNTLESVKNNKIAHNSPDMKQKVIELKEVQKEFTKTINILKEDIDAILESLKEEKIVREEFYQSIKNEISACNTFIVVFENVNNAMNAVHEDNKLRRQYNNVQRMIHHKNSNSVTYQYLILDDYACKFNEHDITQDKSIAQSKEESINKEIENILQKYDNKTEKNKPITMFNTTTSKLNHPIKDKNETTQINGKKYLIWILL